MWSNCNSRLVLPEREVLIIGRVVGLRSECVLKSKMRTMDMLAIRLRINGASFGFESRIGGRGCRCHRIQGESKYYD
jgi:hypothetical protein